jgi:branched-chain amino acid transport system permease protein
MEKPYEVLNEVKKRSRFQIYKKKVFGVPSYLKDWALTFKGGLTIFCLLVLFAFPLLTSNPYYLEIFVLAFIFTIFSASWDFLAGFTGQVSFGHAVFFGISAYTVSASLVFYGLEWWSALLFAIFISMLVGIALGFICLRFKGPYLALGTMVTALMLMNLFKIGQLKDFLWGDEGISGVPPLSTNSVVVYLTVLILTVLSLTILIQITKSNMGKIFRSIRDDETGSEASGINTTKYKIIAFVISGMFAGLAGGLFAMYNRSVNPLMFQPLYSFIVLVMAALGGIATITGSALGAFTYIFLSEILRTLEELGPINPILVALTDPHFVFSIILILIIRFASEGIIRKALEKLKSFWDVLLGR